MSEMQEVELGPEDEAIEAPAEATETKPAKEEKKGKRAKLPEGWGTPIQFNNALGKWLRETGVLEEGDEDPRPQVIYSYIKNKSKDDPFPVHYITEAGEERADDDDETRPALKLEGDENHAEFAEAFAWWERKEERVAKRKENAAAKAKAKAEKAAAKPETAEAAEPAPEAEVEEAE